MTKKKLFLYLFVSVAIYFIVGLILELAFVRRNEYCILFCTEGAKFPDGSFWLGLLPYWPLELLLSFCDFSGLF